MKAVRVHGFGDVATLRIESVPAPEPSAEEVLVRVRAAGVNPYDWMTREGNGAAVTFPWTPGWDLSGTVEAVGREVTAYGPGDEVFAMLADERGAYAESVAVPAANLVPKPASLSHARAAAVPMVSLTAWQALFDHGALQPDQRVLVHAAAGGVGHVAVQFAGWIGARVAGTASGANREYLTRLGVDEVVNYETERFEAVVDPVDLVIDAVGGDTLERSLDVLQPGGRIAKLPGPLTTAESRAIEAHGSTGAYPVVQWKPEQLRTIGRLVADGTVDVHVERVLPLDDVREAHELSESRHVRGKIVLEP